MHDLVFCSMLPLTHSMSLPHTGQAFQLGAHAHLYVDAVLAIAHLVHLDLELQHPLRAARQAAAAATVASAAVALAQLLQRPAALPHQRVQPHLRCSVHAAACFISLRI